MPDPYPLTLIYSADLRGNIGRNGALLHRIPEDLRRFKTLTEGQIVIMGRKTWDSLPVDKRPLPQRCNLVLSRNPALLLAGAVVVSSLAVALAYPGEGRSKFVIGGEHALAVSLPFTRTVRMTHILRSCEGDAKAPFMPAEDWRVLSASDVRYHGSLAYQFVDYQRRNYDHGYQKSPR